VPAYFAIAGVSAPLVAFSYEAAVGVSPQEAHAVIAPTPLTGVPPLYGDVTFGDGTRSRFSTAVW
jgi:hypothetical protein